MLDLFLEKEQDHPDSNHEFGEIPYFAFHVKMRQVHLCHRAGDEYARPQEKPRNGNECAGGAAPVCVPEVNTASEIDGEQDTAERQVRTVAGPRLNQQQDQEHPSAGVLTPIGNAAHMNRTPAQVRDAKPTKSAISPQMPDAGKNMNAVK